MMGRSTMTGTDTRRVGAYAVTRLLDGLFQAPVDILVHLDGAEAGQRLRAAWTQPTIPLPVNAFLLRGPDGITLVDAGCGTDWGPEFGKVRDALHAAGVAREDVRRVLLTHVHPDHAAGLLDGEAAYFPAAAVHAPQGDLTYLGDAAARAGASKEGAGVFDLGDRVLRAYAGRLHPFSPGPVLPGITARAMTGHTPGHSGFLLDDPTDPLLLWGDVLHVDALQLADPRVEVIWDLDPEDAVRSRRATLTDAAREGWAVGGGHVDGFVRVRAEGEGFRGVPA